MHTLAEVEATSVKPDPLLALAEAIERKLIEGDDESSSIAKKRECLGLVADTFLAIFSSDFAKLESLLTDDAEFTTYGPEEMPFTGKVVGWQAIIKRVIENFAGVIDQKIEVIDAVCNADRMAILFHETGRMCATGKTYDVHLTQWFCMQGGRISCIRQVVDSYALCKAKADT